MTEKLINVPHRAIAAGAALLALAVLIVLAAATEGPMRPLPASAPAEEFSAARALTHLQRFATEPRPLGSPASNRARDYLAEQLRAAGLEVEIQRAIGARSASGLATFGRVDNIVATLPGRAPTGILVLAAHYDSAAVGPGASDDGAAVASMLETIRALRAQGPLRNDLVLLITDGEEDGVLGAEAFVREHPLARKGGVLLNWEARGVAGPSLMFETSRNNARLVETFADAVPRPRGDSSMVELYRLLPNNSDFTPLSKAGFRGMNFAYIERSSRYHTADDSIANLDRGSLQHHGSNMSALSRTLGDTDLRALDADHDATYFQVLGQTITFPDHLVRPLAAISIMLLGAVAALARRRRLASIPRILLAALSTVLPLLLSAVLAQILWSLLVAWRPAYDGMGGLLHRPLGYQAAIAALSALALTLWYLPLRRRLGPAALAIGALLWPAALGVLCAWTAPGAAFLFVLPTLFCALGALTALLLPRTTAQAIALTLGAAPAALLLPSWTRVAFDGMGLALGGVAALVIAIFGLTLLPLIELLFPDRKLRRRTALAVPTTALTLAAALTGLGLATDTFNETHPRRTHLAYVLNADTNQATWSSGDPDPAPWTKQHVSSRDTGTLPPGYARGDLWTGPAPTTRAATPRVKVLSRTANTITFWATAPGAQSLTLRTERPITEASATARGLRPVRITVSGKRARTWPGEIRFRDLPPSGVKITIRVPNPAPLRLTAMAETPGLPTVSGHTPRPAGLVAATREDGDLTTVTRTYRL
ncbi:M20/M25/M40 family metallo-hydrolase [Actinomadura hibisca]|uniref:M20/M25/M40 family metallo-hydrolase n=1 Tax=Actinomadura hibisca TaxID=68565 RepID=UPI00082DB01D|nr:M20/M25/M40 family metallo-hydrolase [Actinomadura hibisca]